MKLKLNGFEINNLTVNGKITEFIKCFKNQ